MATNILKADTRKSTFLLKKYLKEKFNIKVKVRSESYSMGSSLNVEYVLGPGQNTIESILINLQYGNFNSMEDIYEHKKEDKGLIIDGYQLEEFKYVFVKQEFPLELKYKFAQFLSDHVNIADLPKISSLEEFQNTRFTETVWGAWDFSNWFYRAFTIKNFITQDEDKINIISVHDSERNGEYYFIYSVEGKKYSTENLIEIKEEVSIPTIAEILTTEDLVNNKIVVPSGEIQIIDYSEKSIVVLGETKPIKGKLFKLGGSFNYHLKCGMGWVFPKTKLVELQDFLSSLSTVSA